MTATTAWLGFGARRRTMLSILAGALAVPVAGCSHNASRLRAGLPDAELDQRVGSYFTLGMGGEEVEAQLRRQSLHFDIGPIPPRDSDRERDRGIAADLYSTGWRYSGPYGKLPSETLYFWFSLDDRLEQIGHKRSERSNLPEGTTLSLRIIAPREVDGS